MFKFIIIAFETKIVIFDFFVILIFIIIVLNNYNFIILIVVKIIQLVTLIFIENLFYNIIEIRF